MPVSGCVVGLIACTVNSAGDRLYLLHISDETKLAWLPAHLTPDHLRHQFDVLAQELNVSHRLCSAACCTGGSQQGAASRCPSHTACCGSPHCFLHCFALFCSMSQAGTSAQRCGWTDAGMVMLSCPPLQVDCVWYNKEKGPGQSTCEALTELSEQLHIDVLVVGSFGRKGEKLDMLGEHPWPVRGCCIACRMCPLVHAGAACCSARAGDSSCL